VASRRSRPADHEKKPQSRGRVGPSGFGALSWGGGLPDPFGVDELQVGLVHEGRRLQRVLGALSRHAIGHVSRFVRPGARRIACTSNDDDLLASAFVHPDGRIATVVLNKTDVARDVLLWMDGRAAKVKSPAHSILTLETAGR
jgi:Glycosyl hydrolase family 30 beta sandwich domain